MEKVCCLEFSTPKTEMKTCYRTVVATGVWSLYKTIREEQFVALVECFYFKVSFGLRKYRGKKTFVVHGNTRSELRIRGKHTRIPLIAQRGSTWSDSRGYCLLEVVYIAAIA